MGLWHHDGVQPRAARDTGPAARADAQQDAIKQRRRCPVDGCEKLILHVRQHLSRQHKWTYDQIARHLNLGIACPICAVRFSTYVALNEHGMKEHSADCQAYVVSMCRWQSAAGLTCAPASGVVRVARCGSCACRAHAVLHPCIATQLGWRRVAADCNRVVPCCRCSCPAEARELEFSNIDNLYEHLRDKEMETGEAFRWLSRRELEHGRFTTTFACFLYVPSSLCLANRRDQSDALPCLAAATLMRHVGAAAAAAAPES